jgi:hypothetical protein
MPCSLRGAGTKIFIEPAASISKLKIPLKTWYLSTKQYGIRSHLIVHCCKNMRLCTVFSKFLGCKLPLTDSELGQMMYLSNVNKSSGSQTNEEV